MLVSRISRRVLAEHHIALSEIYAGTRKDALEEPHVGLIFTGLNVRKSIEKCMRLLRERPPDADGRDEDHAQTTRWPEVIIDGHSDTTFSYIREHLEFVPHSHLSFHF